MHRSCLALALTPLMFFVAFAADLDLKPRVAPKDIPVHANRPACSRWTDECVTCTRETPDAAPVCSNIGIACQPKTIRCLGADVPQNEPSK